MPLVSIITPLFNREDYIVEMIQSIADQTFSDYELIVVNDESTDKSESVAKNALIQKGVPGKVITIRNSGPDHARDIGLVEANGDLVVLLDSDDLWEPDFLLTAVEAYKLSNTEHFFLFTDFKLLYENDNKLIKKSSLLRHLKELEKQSSKSNAPDLQKIDGDMFSYLLTEQPIFIGALAFSRAIIDKVGNFCKIIPERGLSVEWEFYLRCAHSVDINWFYSGTSFVKIRKHDDNVSGFFAKQIDGEVFVLEKINSEYSLTDDQRCKVNKQIASRAFISGYAYFDNYQLADARRCFNKSLSSAFKIKPLIYMCFTFLPSPFIRGIKSLKAALR